MNPTELIARLRTIILRVGLILGGTVLVFELWRWLVSPGGWHALRLKGFRVSDLLSNLKPDGFGEIWIVKQISAWIDGLPAFIGFPVVAILGVAFVYFAYTQVIVPLFHLITRIFVLLTGYGSKKRRHIIICTDGTWNHPEELEGGIIKSSNVYKFWDNLEGERMKFHELTVGADLVKRHTCADGTVQVGLYYPGVGNPASYSKLGVIVGGAFGFGAKSIRREAFRDIIRYYHPGDRITVVGFSRGAAIARWLCAYVEEQGVPRLTVTDTILGKFIVKLLRAALPKSVGFVRKRPVKVDFLGVWDTVASFGLGKNVLGIPFQKINLFTDFKVSSAVKRVVHLLAIDEQRDAFEPTPVAPPKPDSGGTDTIIEEVWFPGVHSNVGGGYLNDGLALISLEYMTARFNHHYSGDIDIDLETTTFGSLEENVKSPLIPSSGAIYDMQPRLIPDNAVIHESVFKKMTLPHAPQVNPGGPAKLEYAPPNVIALMGRLAEHKDKATDYLAALLDEGCIDQGELAGAEKILDQGTKLRVVT